MSGALSDRLDLSRLPPPDLIPAERLDYETLRAERINGLTVRLDAIGFPYDAGGLDSDPFAQVEGEGAYRELLDLQAINDTAEGLLVAKARGANLDQIAANFGVARLVVALLPDGTAVPEDDERLRRRVLLAPDAYASCGTAGGYVFHALTAAPTLADASAIQTGPGEVRVTLLGAAPQPLPTEEELALVRARLAREDVKPLTDVVTVLPPAILDRAVSARLRLLPGPSEAPVVAACLAGLAKYQAVNWRLGRDLRRSALAGRLHLDSVAAVELDAPIADTPASPTQFVHITAVDVAVIGRDE